MSMQSSCGPETRERQRWIWSGEEAANAEIHGGEQHETCRVID